MTTTSRRRPAALALALVAGLALAACSATADGAPGRAEAATRTVDSEFGQVELPTDPQAALGFYTTDVDILATLGVPLASSQPVRDGYTGFPAFFPQDALADVDTFANFPEYSYEAVMAAAPDLILNGLGYDEEAVQRLAEIAPTYSVNAFDGADWRDKFRTTAAALGRTEQADAWFARYDARVAEVREQLDARGIHPRVAAIGWWNDQLQLSCYGVPCLVFADLGLDVAPLALQEDAALSLEQVDQLADVDVAVRSYEPGPAGEAADAETLRTLATSQVWSSLPFVAEDRYFRYDLEMDYGSPSGHAAFLEFLADSLLG